jgi:hypothetical protein
VSRRDDRREAGRDCERDADRRRLCEVADIRATSERMERTMSMFRRRNLLLCEYQVSWSWRNVYFVSNASTSNLDNPGTICVVLLRRRILIRDDLFRA